MSDTYEFIDSCRITPGNATAKYAYPVIKMCRWLRVSTAGFYDWRSRPESATAARRRHLADLVVAIFEANHQRYGYRRVHAVLARSGVLASPELVRQVMAEQDLVACQPRPWRRSLTDNDGVDHRIPDLINRDFTAEAPGQKMVGDITYIPTWEGWLYLATVIDCHSKAILGYAFGDDYKTPLIAAAITQAAQAISLPTDAVFHSDRGSNYTSYSYATTLTGLGITQSVGRTGICYDNALAESFFAAYKNELVHRTATQPEPTPAETESATSTGTTRAGCTPDSGTPPLTRNTKPGSKRRTPHKKTPNQCPKTSWQIIATLDHRHFTVVRPRHVLTLTLTLLPDA